MGKGEFNQVVNANVYLNGNNLLGKAKEIKLPEIAYKMAEYSPLGQFGKFKLPTGVDFMEATIQWNSFYQDVMEHVANPFAALQLQSRSSLEVWDPSQGRIAEKALVTFMTATPQKVPLGTFKQQEPSEQETSYNVTYIKQTLDGEDVIEIDVLANIWKVKGVDLMQQYKENIGG